MNIDFVNHILSLMQSENYLENPEKQVRVCDCEKQIDPVRCLLTDGVDQLVHKLYVLTPEEIKIVEGENEDAD